MSKKKTNDFPRLGIVLQDLIDEVERLLNEAREAPENLGAINWGDLGIMDVEYRLSMLDVTAEPACVVLVEEASPDSKLALWITRRLDKKRFPNTSVECEW